MDWYLKVLKQYADFNGRARRKEYWMFTLFHVIFIIALVFLTFFSGGIDSNEAPSSILIGILVIYILGTILPTIAVTVRRLHDIGKSGWLYLINFIPYIGSFILLILTCMEGEKNTNQWGLDPKGRGNDSSIDLIGRE